MRCAVRSSQVMRRGIRAGNGTERADPPTRASSAQFGVDRRSCRAAVRCWATLDLDGTRRLSTGRRCSLRRPAAAAEWAVASTHPSQGLWAWVRRAASLWGSGERSRRGLAVERLQRPNRDPRAGGWRVRLGSVRHSSGVRRWSAGARARDLALWAWVRVACAPGAASARMIRLCGVDVRCIAHIVYML